jgi:hypothetical protein
MKKVNKFDFFDQLANSTPYCLQQFDGDDCNEPIDPKVEPLGFVAYQLIKLSFAIVGLIVCAIGAVISFAILYGALFPHVK